MSKFHETRGWSLSEKLAHYREECELRNLEECRIPFCSCRLSPRPENECDKRMRGRLQVRDALRRAVA